MSNDYDYLFKLLLIGDSGVGKVRLSRYGLPNELNVFEPSRVCSFGSLKTPTRKATSVR